MNAVTPHPIEQQPAPAMGQDRARTFETSLYGAGSLTALAGASASIALGAPAFVSAALALGSIAAAAAAGTSMWRARAAAVPVPAGTGPMAVTTLSGSLVATNSAFAALMEGRGEPAHPDALAKGPAAALALFSLRRRAIAEGAAEGFLPPSLFAKLTCRDGLIVHVFELAEGGTGDARADMAESLVATIPAAAVVASSDGGLVAANAQYRSLAGEGDTLADGILAEDGVFAGLVRQANAERNARVDAGLRRAQARRVRLTAKPFPGAEDHAVIVLSDVTDQSELEAQIAQSQKMQAIGQLAGGIAHDFNNVLQAIIGFSDLLLQNHRPSDPAFRDIMNIKQSAQRAAGLVKQLLAFSRRQTLRPTVLNLNDVIADLSIMLDRLLGERVRLDLAYGRDLWPVMADLSQLEQVVINLAVNARDAMKGGGTLTIRTRNVAAGEVEGVGADETHGDAVLIEIEDVGTGMPQDMLDKIFEPFFTTKATGEGTGLGLSTVYGIVKQTGGTLSVKSQVGEGTTFRVYLPRTTVEARVEAEPRTASAVVEGERAPGSGSPAADLTGSATVLLAEDEEAIRTFAARALSAKGYRVLSAASGAEAAEIFAEEGDAIDLLVTDVIMPELDGPGLVKQVRAERPDLKVLFMSGYADGASLDELPDAQFLPKPFTLKALAEAVKRELGRS